MTDDFVLELLKKRGIVDPKEQEKFLSPSYDEHLHDPFLMHDMEKAVTRIRDAMEKGEKIVIYADYDCDGIPGAVIMHDLFAKTGYENFSVYIPDRHDEGYGLNHDAVTSFIENDTKLLVTVDLGTTDHADILYAQEHGIDVIVTDHHIPPDTLPQAYALVNPKIEGTYPEPMLCGAGVAFKLAQGFLEKYRDDFSIPSGWEKWLLDMAGLGTLSDMVPLLGENRVIAFYGLKVLRKSPRPGLAELLRKAKVDQRYLTEDDVAFMVTPRINAASRMDSPMHAFELLATKDLARAKALAEHLSKINDERKTLVAHIMKDVHKRLEKRTLGDVIVIGDPTWRLGVLGIIAGKIMEEYQKPVFVWSREEKENGLVKGSCRSDGSIDVVELMRALPDTFTDVGGHTLAGGFSLPEEKVHTLEESLEKLYKSFSREKKDDTSLVDAVLPLSSVSKKFITALSQLAPFGCENPKPLFSFAQTTLLAVKTFGKEGNHLELMLQEGDEERKAIAFFKTPESFDAELAKGGSVTVVGTLEESFFMRRSEIRIRIVSIG